MKTLEVQVTIDIKASPATVWTVITSPQLIKRFLFGTDVKTDWKVGSPITYEGEYQGKHYKDKGVITKFEPCSVFQSTYWSSMRGKMDMPENYNLVTYTLKENQGGTTLLLTQDNIATEEEKQHSEMNWEMTLQKLKEVAETA